MFVLVGGNWGVCLLFGGLGVGLVLLGGVADGMFSWCFRISWVEFCFCAYMY